MLRRPLKSRSNPAIQRLAKGLANAGATPNQVSIWSIVFSAGAAAALISIPAVAPHSFTLARVLFFVAAWGIQLRLLCNVLDGLIAVEGGKKSAVGAIYNELPDRVADVLTLVGLGYSIRDFPWTVESGWLAAVLAVSVAYVRALGGSLGLTQDFRGPMAKPHRMFIATVICVFATFAPWDWVGTGVLAGLLVIIGGSIITMVRRTANMAQQLYAREV